MKLISKIFFLFLLLSQIAKSQEIMWQRIYDYNHQQNAANNVIQTIDGGYLIAATTVNPVKILLIKIDYLGTKEWEKVIGDSSGNFISPSAIQQTKDSGYVVTGQRGYDIFILKLNGFGNSQWIKYFNRSGGDARSNQIFITNEHGYIVAGDIFFLSESSSKSYLVKTDTLGNFEWDNLYGDSIFTSGTYILPSDNGGFYLTNTTKSGSVSPYVGMCYKLDSKGNTLWKSIIGLKKGGLPILSIKDSITCLAGLDESNSSFKFCLTKLNGLGDILFQKSYDSSHSLTSICYNSNFDFIFCGSKLVNQQHWNFAVTKIDINGNYVGSKIINNPKNSDDFCNQIIFVNDKGYLLIGTTNYGSTGFKDDNILAVKTDSQFNASPILDISGESITLPYEFKLNQNYPNPFNPTTLIQFSLPKQSFVSLKIYDPLGKEISTLVNEKKSAGSYQVEFNPNNLSTGVYFYTLQADVFTETKRMVLIK